MKQNSSKQSGCEESRWDFSDLRALFINTTLKKSPQLSHTDGLWHIAKIFLQKNAVVVDELRLIDRLPAFGIYPDMTVHGWDEDVRLGERSSVCSLLIERLYANFYWLGEAGPGPSYLNDDSGGPENDFTNRNVTFMTWNLLHLAHMLKGGGGVPAHGEASASQVFL